MAVRISRPGGRFTRISPAPSYGAVISRYSDQIKQAIDDQDQAEIELKILSYKNGELSWDDLKTFMEKKILGTPEGTLKQTRLQQSFVELANFETERRKQTERAKLEAQKADQGITPKERYEIEQKLLNYETPGTEDYTRQQARVIEAFEGAETQKVMQKRNELIQKYSPGGISAQEELLINQELKAIANPDSQIFNQLVVQEQQLRERVATENKAAGQTALTNTSRDQLAAIANAERQSDINYQSGVVSGYDRDVARYQNAQEAVQVLQKMANAGISVPMELLTQAQNNLSDAATLVQARQNGTLFDVIDNSGAVRPVTTDGRDPFTGKAVDYRNFPVQLNPTTGLYEVYDPATGQVLNKGLGSKRAAEQFAEDQGLVTFDAIIVGRDGKPTKKQLSQDKETGVFFNAQNPSEVYVRLPQNQSDAGRYSLTNAPANWRTDPAAKQFIQQQAQNITTQYGPFQTDIGAALTSRAKSGQQQQSGQQKGLLESVGDFFGSLSDPQRQAEANARGEKLIKEDIPQLPGKIVQGVTQGVQDIVRDPGRAVQQAGQSLGQAFLATNPVTGPFTLANNIGKAVTGRDVVGDVLSNVRANIGPVAQNIGQSIGQTFGQTSKSVQQAVPSALSSTFSNIGSGISSAIGNIPSLSLPKLPSLNLPPLPKLDFNFSLPSFGGSSSSSSRSSSKSPSFDFFGGISKTASDIGRGVSSFASNVGSSLGGLFNKAKGLFGF